MSTTRTTKSYTANYRGRDRGRGRHANDNSRSTPDEDSYRHYPYNERRSPDRSIYNHREHQRTVRDQVEFRCNYRGNFRPNNPNNPKPKIQINKTGKSSDTDIGLPTIPKHAKNPFFVRELMSRFNNLLPSPGFLEDEVPGDHQPEVNLNTNTRSNIHSMNIRSGNAPNSTTGTPTNTNPRGNISTYNQNGNVETNKSRNSNYKNSCSGEPQPNFIAEEQLPNFATGNKTFENLKTNSNYVSKKSRVSPHDNLSKHSNHEPIDPHRNPDNSTKSTNEPRHSNKISLEKRKAIMENFGFNIASLGKKDGDIPKNKETGLQLAQQNLVSIRASPRVRNNLMNAETTLNVPYFTREPNENDTSMFKHKSHQPPNSFVPNKVNISQNSNHHDDIWNTRNVPSPIGKPFNGNSMKKEAENKTQHCPISDTFFTQLDSFRKPVIRSPRNFESSLGNQTNENRLSPNSASNFNPFLKAKQTTSQGYKARSNSPNQRKRRFVSNDRNSAVSLPESPRLTGRDVAGRTHFNVQRPVRDLNERIPSREEALERLQVQYEIQRAEFETKKREKEAKKREEYLARYKHVDQGHRMNEGLLDEAAGYGYEMETVEDVRERQQEQLRRDALAYQERVREEEEKQKKRQEKKQKEQINKNQNYEGGYRLGNGIMSQSTSKTNFNNKQKQRESRECEEMNNFASIMSQSTSKTNFNNKQKQRESRECEEMNNFTGIMSQSISKTNFNSKQKQRESHGCEELNKKEFTGSISPELLLEGETEEEAFQRQEEQLILELLIQQQMERLARNEKLDEENNLTEFQDNGAQHSANSEVMNPFIPKKTPTENRTTANQGTSRNYYSKQLNQPASSSSEMAKHTTAKYSALDDKKEQTNEQIVNNRVNCSNLPEDMKQLGTKRQNLPLEKQNSNLVQNSVLQIPPTSLGVGREPDPSLKNPVSCVLKNKNGSVLVLRPTPADLNRALGRRLEVQEEVDKLGYSTHYKPQAEQVPMYSNNRFERKPYFDTVNPSGDDPRSTGAIPKSTGAIPKSNGAKPKNLAPTQKPNSESDHSPSTVTTAEQDEPTFDPKAELRAARLRFQQQYEETLRKKQEQRNDC